MINFKDKIKGKYKLQEFFFLSKNGSKHYPFGIKVAGLLIYDNDIMSAQLGSLDRNQFESEDYRLGKKDEIIESFNNYISYMGKYQVFENGTYIVHRVEQSLFPNWIGKNVKRFYEFQTIDNQEYLTLKASPILHNQEEVTPYLIWKKF